MTAVNTFGADGLASRHTSAGDVTYTHDPFGSVSQVLTGDAVLVGDISNGYGYQDWQPGGEDPAPYSYQGQNGYYADNINALILCTHRFYDQFAGRWLTRDPMGYAGGINLYEYAGNNPVNESDPSGFFAGAPPGVGPGVGTVLEEAGGGLLLSTAPVLGGILFGGSLLLGCPKAAGRGSDLPPKPIKIPPHLKPNTDCELVGSTPAFFNPAFTICTYECKDSSGRIVDTFSVIAGPGGCPSPDHVDLEKTPRPWHRL